MGRAIDKRGDPLAGLGQCDSLCVAAELLDHGTSALGKGLEVVAAFKDRNDFTRAAFCS